MFSPADVLFVVGYGSARGEGDAGWRSPTLSERSEDFPSLRGMARHPSQSTISLQSAPSSFSGSPRRKGSSTADLPPSPRPASLASRTPAVATAPQSESLVSQNASPRIQSPIVSTRSFSSLSEHLARNAAPPVRPSLSRQPTPRVPTPLLSPVRSRSRTTATPAIHSAPRTYSSRKPSVTAVAAPHSSDTEETVPGGNDTPKPKAPSIVKPPKTRAAVWHCRICKEDPCTVPTAAMCGHIFCTPCILQELVKTGACPVCRKMILLRLHVEPE
ncbi:hypothetical protein C8Q74DRAFT_1039356 [Fomes fomentarius]|nr:hypothetical protein C8Q74DRAFT_1039356 [Fomes fomentarius]